MTETATETVVEQVHTDAPVAPSEEMHTGESLGEFRARIDALETWRNAHEIDHAPKASVIEEEIEEVEQTAEIADMHADMAEERAVDAQETAEVAEQVAVVAAEIAVEAEETAEAVEDIVVDEVIDDGSATEETVTEVPAEETSAATDDAAPRSRRRGVYGRR